MKPSGHIAEQAWMLKAETRKIMEVLNASGKRARFNGGCVRNALINKENADIDIATELAPEEVIAVLDKAEIKSVPTGIVHGTVTAIVDGTPFEITTLRKDIETDGRHATVEFTDDWLEDASRRDFTMNAMYMDLDGTLYDAFGGTEDLREGRVRFVGNAEERIREDVLRILRFFRFFAHYGTKNPDDDALAACKNLAHLIPNLSGERVCTEVLKLLSADTAAQVWQLMQDDGVLEHLLPAATNIERLERMIVIESRFEGADPLRRLAALLSEGAESVAEQLRLSNKQKARLKKLLKPSVNVVPGMEETEIRTAIYAEGNGIFVDLLFLHAKDAEDADLKGAYDLAEAFQAPKFPLSGTDVMKLGVSAGPDVGKALGEIETWWIENDFVPDRGACLDELNNRYARE